MHCDKAQKLWKANDNHKFSCHQMDQITDTIRDQTSTKLKHTIIKHKCRETLNGNSNSITMESKYNTSFTWVAIAYTSYHLYYYEHCNHVQYFW